MSSYIFTYMKGCVFIFLIFSLGIQSQSPTAHVQDIYSSLIDSYSKTQIGFPSILVIDRTKNIASFSKKNNRIIIERQAYDICQSFGDKQDDALAFLIAHELTHFFQLKKETESHDDMNLYSGHDHSADRLEMETEADRFGAFLCYLAGYDYITIAPKTIKTLYKAYDVDSKENLQYPSMEGRQKLTGEVCMLVDKYVTLFKTANYLHLIGEYEIAQSLYAYLLEYLDFPELYNNAGVNQLSAVLVNNSNATHYPINLIFNSSLRDGLNEHPNNLLTKAGLNFSNATRKDPSNHLVFINHAIVLIELKQIEAAKKMLDQLKEVATDKKVLCQLDQLNSIIKGKDENDCKSGFVKNIEMRHVEFPKVELVDNNDSFIIDDSDPFYLLTCRIEIEQEIKLILRRGDKEVMMVMPYNHFLDGGPFEIIKDHEENIFKVYSNDVGNSKEIFIKIKY